MIFQVKRVSTGLSAEPQPCENAVKINDHWEIEIKTLEDLMGFINTNGPIIFFEQNEIRIYDGYIE